MHLYWYAIDDLRSGFRLRFPRQQNGEGAFFGYKFLPMCRKRPVENRCSGNDEGDGDGKPFEVKSRHGRMLCPLRRGTQ